MDNFGFQHDIEEASFTLSENSNNDYNLRPGNPHLLSCQNVRSDRSTDTVENNRYSSMLPNTSEHNLRSQKLSSSSFNLPKNKTLNKYRRFSGSFSTASQVPYSVGKKINIPSSEIKCDNVKSSSFIISDNNSVSVAKRVPDLAAFPKNYQRHSSEDSGYIDVTSFMPIKSELPYHEYQPNNSRVCSPPISFHGHASLLNNVQESSNNTSVPSLSLNNSYHDGYLCSIPSFSKSQSVSPSFSSKNNLVRDTSVELLKALSPKILKSTNKYSNITGTFLNNSQCSEASTPSLQKNHKYPEDECVLNSLPRLMKSQNNSNKILNRASTLPNITMKNARNQNQEYLSNATSGIQTVSANIPMYYPGFMNQPTSPRPCAENRQNMRRSSKIMRDSEGSSGDRRATLKKRGILRGWKLQFIPSDHSRRRTIALCCMLLLAGVMVLVATGLVIYMTTAMKTLPMKLQGCHVGESGVNVVAGEFRIINEKYEPSLKDENSIDFKQLAAQITQQLDLLFSASTLSLHYNHSHVMQLSHGFEKMGNGAIINGGIHVKCKLVLISPPPHGEAANQAGLEFLRGLQHRHGQMWLGDFVIDIQSIGFTAVVDPSSPPEHTPDPALLPGWSSWSSWSECNSSSSISINTQTRTRLCLLNSGAGAELASIEPCLLLEEAGGDMEVRDCEFNISTVTVMSSRVLEEGEVISNDIGTDTTVPPTAISSSSSVDLLDENTVTVQSTILKRTTDNLNVQGDNITETNATRNSPSIPVMDLSLSSYRHCDECISDEVCVALSGEQVPTCRKAKDPKDPTGCGGHCLINLELCHKLDVDAFRCLDDSYCLPNEWRCANQLCIPQVKRCDGHMNCYDHTDEFHCECNLTTHFHCSKNTSCLPLKKRCDGIIDCWDGSDELNCTIACPSVNEFTCTDGQCIPHVHFCDGYADCRDKSDEPFGCGGECKNHEWKCGNGRCIKKKSVCDGSEDCGDGTDETSCPLSRRPHLNTGIS